MLSCEECRNLLPQYIADGEPAMRLPAGLDEHLSACAECRELAVRLRFVEAALLAYPMAEVPPELARNVTARLQPAEQRSLEEWHWLPWDLWVPALALLVAVALVCFSVPAPTLSSAPQVALGPVTLSLIEHFPRPGAASQGGPSWAIWMAASVALAAGGIAIGFKAWTQADESAHRAVQDQVEDVTRILGNLIGRTP